MATKKKAGEDKVKSKKGAKHEEADADEDEDAEEADADEDEDEDEAPARPSKAAKAKAEKAEKPEKPEKAEKPEKPAKVEAAPKKKAPAPISRGAGQAPVYQQSQTYSVGDVIYHPVWETEGKVLEVGETTQGNKKIVVDFGGLGKKTLLASYVEPEAATN